MLAVDSLQEERDSFAANLLGRGLVDSFRRQYPEVAGYTWWSRRLKCRENNKGWRLDYFLVRLCCTLVQQPYTENAYSV